MNKHEIAKEIFKDLYNYKVDESDSVCMKTILQLGEIKELKEFARMLGSVSTDNLADYAREYLMNKVEKKWGISDD